MKKNISIGNVSALPGTKEKGFLKVVDRPDGTPICLPILIVNGAKDGPTLVASAGQHGSEIPSIYAIIKVFQALEPEKMSGAYIGVHVLNYPAYEFRERTVPLVLSDPGLTDTDIKYPGDPKGWIQQRIAHTFLNEVASLADYYMDHHGGSRDYEQLGRVVPNDDSESPELAKATGWQFIEEPRPSKGIDKLLKEKGKLRSSLLMESSGGVWQVDAFQEAVNQLFEGDMNVMKHLKMIQGKKKLLARNQMIIERIGVSCEKGGLLIPEDGWEIMKKLEKGAKIASILNLLGEKIETLNAPADGLMLGGKRTLVVQPGESILRFGKVLKVINQSKGGD
jgi:hypothetical protein